jgi:hypothetical protein
MERCKHLVGANADKGKSAISDIGALVGQVFRVMRRPEAGYASECTVLHEAISALGGASRGNKALVELLINIGADLKVKNKDGKTALHLAIEEENKAVVRLLRIEEGALKRRRTTTGRQQLRQRTRFLKAFAH